MISVLSIGYPDFLLFSWTFVKYFVDTRDIANATVPRAINEIQSPKDI